MSWHKGQRASSRTRFERSLESGVDTIPQVFLNTVRTYGDRVAMRYKKFGLWRDISWNEYYQYVSTIAAGLISMGLTKGDRVAIIGDNCYQWVVIDMAVMCSGGVSVGVYATNSWDQCQYIVDHSDAKFYFVENEEQLDKWLNFKDAAPQLRKVIVWDLDGLRDFKDPQVISFDDLIELGKQELEKNPMIMEERLSAITSHDMAMFIYTSGTTGRPKGAIITHRNVTWVADAIMRANPMYDTDEVLSYLPLCHVFERIFSVFAHIRYGYTVNFIETLDTITDNMREISPTVGYAVPRIWEKYHSAVVIKMSDATWMKQLTYKLAMAVAKKRYVRIYAGQPVPGYLAALYFFFYLAVFRKLKERLGFERLRVAFSGAAPISSGVLAYFNSIGVPLLEGYGQTEGTGVTTVCRLNSMKAGTVGKPLDGVSIKIAEDGEILVRSPGVFSGYYKDSELTDETIADGWLCTGDVGEFDQDGNLKITGRKKDIIITSGGKNITPLYIEDKIVFSPYISDAIVVGDGKNYLTALIVLDEDNMVKYAQDNKIQFSTYKDLSQHPEIRKLIQKHIDIINESLSRVEQVKKFAVLPHKLYQEEGDVTPTMKVKRRYILTKYKDLIDPMYR